MPRVPRHTRLLLLGPVLCLVGTSSLAEARRQPLNMPLGWVWPPSTAMKEEGQTCLRRLTRLGLAYKKAATLPKVTTPIIVPDMTFSGLRLLPRGDGPFVLDCQLAEVLATHAAPALRELGVVALRIGSLYRLTRVRRTRILSRHAIGLALDVRAFIDEEGVEHVVTRYWRDPLLRRLAARIRDTGAFRRPLTPGNDPKHHGDHFHLEGRTALERTLRPLPSS